MHESKSKQTWQEAYRSCHIATVEQLQLEKTDTHTVSFTVSLETKVKVWIIKSIGVLT